MMTDQFAALEISSRVQLTLEWLRQFPKNAAGHALILNPKLPADEIRDLGKILANLQHLEPNLAPAIWLASSGSSKGPDDSAKIIALKPESLLASAAALNDYFCVTEKDVFVQVLPCFHVGGLGVELRSRLAGASCVSGLRGADQKWDPEYFYEILKSSKGTVTSLVPTQIHDLLAKNFSSPESLRVVLVGGATLSGDLEARARDAGWPLFASYGMTEASSTVAIACAGQELELLPHLEASVNDESLLKLRGPSIMMGWMQRKKEQVSYHAGTDEDGWFQTADRVQLNDRELEILGRGSDFIKVLGEGVNLQLLRETLAECLQDLQLSELGAALLARPHPRVGAEIILLLEDELADQEHFIRDAFNASVRPFERIQRASFIDQIPRSPLGKPLLEQIPNI